METFRNMFSANYSIVSEPREIGGQNLLTVLELPGSFSGDQNIVRILTAICTPHFINLSITADIPYDRYIMPGHTFTFLFTSNDSNQRHQPLFRKKILSPFMSYVFFPKKDTGLITSCTFYVPRCLPVNSFNLQLRQNIGKISASQN